MKQLISVPFNGYVFWRISRTALLKHCMHQYGRYFSAIRPVQETHHEMFSKPVLYSRHKNIQPVKTFSSDSPNSVLLMDFDVWTYPKFPQFFKDIYNMHFVLKDLDSFSVVEFNNSSKKALEVVTTLLSQLKFPELEGLLTPECKEQVSRNMLTWNMSEASFLSYNPKNLLLSLPCDILIYSDEQNKDKMFFEIRVIYYVWLKHTSKIGSFYVDDFYREVLHDMNPTNKKMLMYSVYNCKFIKEITKGTSDQWTIKKINLRIFPTAFTTD